VVVDLEPSQLGNAVLPRLAGWEEQTAPLRWGCARQSKPVHVPEGCDLQTGRRNLDRETWESHAGGGERKEHHNGRVLSFRLSASHTL